MSNRISTYLNNSCMYLNIELVRLLPYHPVIGMEVRGKQISCICDRPRCRLLSLLPFSPRFNFDEDLFASVSRLPACACQPTLYIHIPYVHLFLFSFHPLPRPSVNTWINRDSIMIYIYIYNSVTDITMGRTRRASTVLYAAARGVQRAQH